MSGGARGLYESLITEALAARLGESTLEPRTEELRAAEAPDRIALHLATLIRRAIASLPDARRAEAGIDIARQLIAVIDETCMAPTSPRRAHRARYQGRHPPPVPGDLFALRGAFALTRGQRFGSVQTDEQ